MENGHNNKQTKIGLAKSTLTGDKEDKVKEIERTRNFPTFPIRYLLEV